MILRDISLEPSPFYQGRNCIIYKGTVLGVNKKIVAKFLKSQLSQQETSRLKHEYEITKIFLSDKHISHALSWQKFDNNYAIILDYIDAQPLSALLVTKLSELDFLTLALKITCTLQTIHQHQIIHKDINPDNILCNAVESDIYIIDFGLSVDLPKEKVEIHNVNILEGSIAYISPEQTGRMNRGIDYRTDFYSLGVTFYRMITGELPFNTNDILELVHAHMAIIPPSPHEIDSSISETVSKIIMKLMAKQVETRRYCFQQLNSTGL